MNNDTIYRETEIMYKDSTVCKYKQTIDYTAYNKYNYNAPSHYHAHKQHRVF